MQRWRTAPSAGSLVGILGILLCACGIGGVIFGVLPGATDTLAPVLWGIVGLLALVALGLAILLCGYFTLGYRLDEADGGALIIRWAWRTVRLPLAEIEYLGPARQILGDKLDARLWPWPGYYLNSITDAALGRIRLFATVPLRRQIIVCSARGSFGISPDRPAAFAARFTALNEAIERGGPLSTLPLPVPTPIAIEDEEEIAYPSSIAVGQRAFQERTGGQAISLFADRMSVSLLLLGGALVATMLWFILVRFDAVPQTLPLHYNLNGRPDRIGTPREIFYFPLIAALITIANFALAWSVIRFDRFAARLLLGGTCLAQLVAWVALLKIF
jgi:hypothetical protein